MGRLHKSSVNIPEASRRPHVSSISNNFNTEISVQSNDFNVKNKNAVSPLHDFKVGLTSVQGKLELLDSSNSNLISSNNRAHARHHVFTTWSMA